MSFHRSQYAAVPSPVGCGFFRAEGHPAKLAVDESIKTWWTGKGGKAVGAIGCNVCFGIAPDKSYSSYQVYGREEALLTTLYAGQSCWHAIDAFNESGVTGGTICAMRTPWRGYPPTDAGKSRAVVE